MPERQGSALHTARQVLIPLPSGKQVPLGACFLLLRRRKGSNPFTAAIKKELIFSSFLFVYNAKVG